MTGLIMGNHDFKIKEAFLLSSQNKTHNLAYAKPMDNGLAELSDATNAYQKAHVGPASVQEYAIPIKLQIIFAK